LLEEVQSKHKGGPRCEAPSLLALGSVRQPDRVRAFLKAYVASIKITNEAVTDLMSIITNRQSH